VKRDISSQGFTLIELLVVISIIALLISILLPALRRAREEARMMVCATNQRQVAISLTSYATDERGELPQSIQRWNNTPPNWTFPYRFNYNATNVSLRVDRGSIIPQVRPYATVPDILHCPLKPEQLAFVEALQRDWNNPNNLTSNHLSGGYFYMWNFEGFPSFVRFKPARSLEDAGDGLLTSDLFIQDNISANWETSHPAMPLTEFPSSSFPRYRGLVSLPKPVNFQVNSSFIDGHVKRTMASELDELRFLSSYLYLPIPQN